MEKTKEKKMGTCSFCGNEFAKTVLKNHFKKCDKKPKIKEGDKIGKYFLISVEGMHFKDYWLYISVSSIAKLQDIDSFLRKIWLECCGHLSSFTIDRVRYEEDDDEGFYKAKRMTAKLNTVLYEGLSFTHEYDFGSTTILQLKVIEEYEDIISKEKVQLLARNVEPKIICTTCEKNVAVEYCCECDEWLCKKCIKTHECDENMRLPVVNSPRTGVCGYCGEE